jgi:outer membrane protein TolC
MRAFIFLIFLILFAHFVNAETNRPLSLQDYLIQVNSGDPGLKAADKYEKSATGYLRSNELATSVRLLGEVKKFRDARPNLQPTFQGERTLGDQYIFGLSQQSSWGPKWALTQNWTKTEIQGSNLLLTTPIYYDDYPKLELSIPIWRNWAGEETRAQKNQTQLLSQAQLNTKRLELQQRKNTAEIYYWQMANIQERLQIQKDNLARAQRLFQSAQKKVIKSLTDNSDLYQAEAAVQLRQLDLVQTEQEMEQIARNFNRLRGQLSSNVSEKLSFVPVDTKLVKPISMSAERLDYTSQKLANRAKTYGAESQRSSFKPNLDVVAQVYKQGRDSDSFSGASSSLRENKYDAWFVGIQFSTPLDFTLTRDLTKAAEAEALATEFDNDRIAKESLSQSLDFSSQGKSLAQSLEIVRNLELVQLKKAEEEKKKLQTGRTVLAQVLLFEQDYANTRAQRLQLDLQVRNWLIQRNLFLEGSN